MTNRYIEPVITSSICKEENNLRIGLIHQNMATQFSIADPKKMGKHLIFCNDRGDVFPLQEICSRYGQHSPEYIKVNMDMLGLGHDLFMVEVPLNWNGKIDQMRPICLKSVNYKHVKAHKSNRRRFHTFEQYCFNIEKIRSTLYMRLKQAFIAQTEYFEHRNVAA